MWTTVAPLAKHVAQHVAQHVTRHVSRRIPTHFLLSVRSLLLAIAVGTITSAVTPSAALAQSSPAPKASSEFTILIYESAAVMERRNDPRLADAYWSSYDRFAAELMKAGVLRGGTALDERGSGNVRGPGSPGRGARLSGYFVIAAPDLETARRLARQAPTEAVAVEVRAHRANPHMSAPGPQRP